ncbi:hypothetical protein HDU98_001686, partial [Podochytrium sp. JEL0797]
MDIFRARRERLSITVEDPDPSTPTAPIHRASITDLENANLDDTTDKLLAKKRIIAAAVARRFQKICLANGSSSSRRQHALDELTQSNDITKTTTPSTTNTFPPLTPMKQLHPSVPTHPTIRISPTTTTPPTRVSRERIHHLWHLVRMHFFKSRTPGILQTLQAERAAAPYTLGIKQGFQFKYRLRTKYQIKCLILHSKLPWHLPDEETLVGGSGVGGGGTGEAM